jgi:hypothetical protein
MMLRELKETRRLQSYGFCNDKQNSKEPNFLRGGGRLTIREIFAFRKRRGGGGSKPNTREKANNGCMYRYG